MKEETKVRKAAEESGQCNMRTVTTEDNPYKVAGDILFASSEVESDFRSVDLYGSSVRRKKEDAICSRFHLENESGTGDIAVYQTFPGMELVYNDMHMEYCNKMQSPRPGFIEINYCREGRCECAFGERSYCYMAAGNLSICTLHKKSHTSTFPTSHYHGITITIELEEITDEMRRILKLLSINLTRISEFAGKQDFYMVRANETVQHIFSELYTVQEHIKPSYIRIKLLELLLILTEISPTAMKRCFKGMYGAPVYAYLRTYRLQIAEKLLREGNLSVGEIATEIGYTNPNKFTSAFRGEYGMTPTEYKKNV